MFGKRLVILTFLIIIGSTIQAQQNTALDTIFEAITKGLNDANEKIKESQKSSITVYNNTTAAIYYAYALYDYENNYWKSIGWLTIEPYKEEEWDLSGYTGNIFIFGHQVHPYGGQDKFWSGDSYFCIDPEGPFEIRYADRVNCDKENRLGFIKKYITTGKNYWTFNP